MKYKMEYRNKYIGKKFVIFFIVIFILTSLVIIKNLDISKCYASLLDVIKSLDINKCYTSLMNKVLGNNQTETTPLSSVKPPIDKDLPLVKICKNNNWIVKKGVSWAQYNCSEECPTNSLESCTYFSDNEVDANGKPMKMLAFVVDQMAGELRWNEPFNEKYKAALIVHTGGGGNSFWEDRGESSVFGDFRKALEQAGLLMIEIKWQEGVGIPDGFASGWLTHIIIGERSNIFIKSKRPAAVIKWAHDYLVPKEVRMGTLGCSDGSNATFAPVYWHGLGTIVDYQLLGGGPAYIYDMNSFCKKQTDKTALQIKGICETDPKTVCTKSDECPSGAKCAYPNGNNDELNGVGKTALTVFKRGFDFIHYTGNTCLTGNEDPSFLFSSFKYNPGNFNLSYPVDVINDIQDSCQAGMSDTSLGITYHSGMTYNNVTTSDPLGKRWLTHNGCIHCAWLGDANFLLNNIKPAILRGLKF